MHIAFCPMGTECKWGNKRLGKFASEQEARDKVKWHLQMSEYHNCDEDTATSVAASAELTLEEEWPSWSSWSKGKGSSKGGGKSGTAKAWYGPYSSSDQQPQQQLVVSSPAVPCVIDAPAALTSMVRCESAARTAARMSRTAAQGFEAEADNIAMEIARLKAAMQ